jgi:hypothetical protein
MCLGRGAAPDSMRRMRPPRPSFIFNINDKIISYMSSARLKNKKQDDIKDFTYFAEDYFIEKWRSFMLFEPFL